MNFDANTGEFVLDVHDRTLLDLSNPNLGAGAQGVPERWPQNKMSGLLDLLTHADNRIDSIDVSEWPAGADRNRIVNWRTDQAKRLRGMRGVLAQHVRISDSDCDRLLKAE